MSRWPFCSKKNASQSNLYCKNPTEGAEQKAAIRLAFLRISRVLPPPERWVCHHRIHITVARCKKRRAIWQTPHSSLSKSTWRQGHCKMCKEPFLTAIEMSVTSGSVYSCNAYRIMGVKIPDLRHLPLSQAVWCETCFQIFAGWGGLFVRWNSACSNECATLRCKHFLYAKKPLCAALPPGTANNSAIKDSRRAPLRPTAFCVHFAFDNAQ